MSEINHHMEKQLSEKQLTCFTLFIADCKISV